jgi:hypothetical protein
MICADFLAGVSLETNNGDSLLEALMRLISSLPFSQRKQLQKKLEDIHEVNPKQAAAIQA